jgi:alanine dehydrogenase
VDGALRANKGLAEGVYLYRGRIVNEAVAGVFSLPAARLSDVMREGGAA